MMRVACVLAAASLFACGHTRNELSGPDAERINAAPLALDSIADDTVDVEEGDATDWRFIDVEQVGILNVEVHWDIEQANLSLDLYDALGKSLATGAIDGKKGRKLSFEVGGKARYYVRVDSTNEYRSSYSLKASFERKAPKRCHNCTEGQQICVGKDGYAICRKTAEGCNAWVEILSCSKDTTCKDGKCDVGCIDQCKPDDRRCASGDAVQICVRGPSGCMQWDVPSPCASDMVCKEAKCKKRQGKPPPPPPTAKDVFVTGRIISMYTKDGKRTLHIEIGEGQGVEPGMTGVVLEGGTQEPVTNGQFKVVRVTGKFCIAETGLDAIGNNRTVRIKVR